ncbi:pyruvate formate lyase activating enzyme [Stemphylium lycopersici]|nr:pyruvate formate lyase activating enzyme [Stemphylium lycopersici]
MYLGVITSTSMSMGPPLCQVQRDSDHVHYRVCDQETSSEEYLVDDSSDEAIEDRLQRRRQASNVLVVFQKDRSRQVRHKYVDQATQTTSNGILTPSNTIPAPLASWAYPWACISSSLSAADAMPCTTSFNPRPSKSKKTPNRNDSAIELNVLARNSRPLSWSRYLPGVVVTKTVDEDGVQVIEETNHPGERSSSLGKWGGLSSCIAIATPQPGTVIPSPHFPHVQSDGQSEFVSMSLLSKLRPALKPRPATFCPHRVPLASARRSLYLAPPYLLDDYIPRYHLLSSVDAAKKRSLAYAHLRECNLCPRLCGVNRYEKTGVCLIGAEKVKVGTIAPHFGEEPFIQGHNGSGSVFFSGCNLRCVFCQNHDISHTRNGFDLTPEELAEWYIKLQQVGRVHNINLVTPEHVVPQVVLSILHARELGLRLPIIYNTSSFDSLESINLLDGLVDIYMPDFKVWNDKSSKRLLKADNYPSAAMESIKAMHEQVGDLCFTADGIAKKGLIVRHLVMPGMEDEGKAIMRWLAENLGKHVMVHIMEQYFPRAYVGKQRRRRASLDVVEPGGVGTSPKANEGVRYADINRPVSLDHVASVKKAAQEAGLWRDTWQAVALQYKSAFEAQTTRLQELQDVCFATQAKLENERAEQRRLHRLRGHGENHHPNPFDGIEDPQSELLFGTATVFLPSKIGSERARPLSDDYTDPLFRRVHKCADQRNYGTALVEVERLLRGPLSAKSRAKGLLLKSNVLRASGPDELFDALAACSEAVELCDRLSELENFLPRVQYQRGLLYYELGMLRQAHDAFSAVSDDDLLSAHASEFRKSYDDELNLLRCAKRRSGFDENRTMEGLLAQLEEKGIEAARCRQGKENVVALPLGESEERRTSSRRVNGNRNTTLSELGFKSIVHSTSPFRALKNGPSSDLRLMKPFISTHPTSNMSPHSSPPPIVPNFHDILPKYISAFENKVHDYIVNTTTVLPSPAVQNESYDCVSPLIPPFREEEASSSWDGVGLDDEVYIDHVPADLREHEGSKTCERLVLFRIFMTQCQTLQSSIEIWEHRPHTGDAAERSRRCYSKIRRLAMRMRQLAEALGSRELQARSEYWAGRGCGGQRDWLTAMTHFAAAIKLDVPNDVNEYKQIRRRGLLQKEKDDIEFLLHSATQRHEDWLRRTEVAREALKEPGFEDVDWEALKGPYWSPNHEFMTYVAEQQREKNKKLGKLPNYMRTSKRRGVPILSQDEVNIVMEKLAVSNDKQAFRTTLSAEEWRYILRGDLATKKRDLSLKTKGKKNEEVAIHAHRRTALPSSSGFSLDNSQHSQSENAKNLCDELEQVGYSEEETPPLSPEFMSPITSLVSNPPTDHANEVTASSS